ncbi:MAG: PorT family protein [Bacteroidales bacterium]|nr:PorT family protein [Bacteroidales bacterium]
MKIFTTIILIFISFTLFSQRDLPKNLPKYDQQKMHFGMALGINTMDFTIHNSPDFFFLDSIYSIENRRNVGFNINIVANYNIVSKLSIRCLPGLNFGQRNLEYEVFTQDSLFKKVDMMLESTFLDIPILFKYKSDRLNNFRAYIVGGGAFRYDLAARNFIKPEEQPKVRLRKADWYYEVGFGTDFFLEYFKFAMEIKYTVGIRNILVSDATQFTSSIERMNSKMLIISLLFEGSDASNFFSFFDRSKRKR